MEGDQLTALDRGLWDRHRAVDADRLCAQLRRGPDKRNLIIGDGLALRSVAKPTSVTRTRPLGSEISYRPDIAERDDLGGVDRGEFWARGRR